MRIVAMADTHMFHEELVVPDGDVLVHAGDLCRGGTLEELREVADWIRRLPHATKVVVAGNHDWAFVHLPEDARALLGPDVVYLEDSGAEIGGVSFWGSPWQPEFYGWAFNLPRGPLLAERWARIPESTNVVITHGPVEGLGDGSSVGHVRAGCADLRARLRVLRPWLHLCGHIHEDGGAWSEDGTTYVNCTTWECERAPTVIDVDVATGLVRVEAPPRRPVRA
ncbi:MAG: metallophosphatase domain-containing protein [Deltaproteobacteria bacterium]|nr:metallophosphatase domain-containing protein [Deltaproteobacteria bacterium]